MPQKLTQNGIKWSKVVSESHSRRQDMLIGQYEGKVGAKGRTAFPKKFREILGDKLIITFGYENSLIVVSEQNWKALLEGTEGKPFIPSQPQKTQKSLLQATLPFHLTTKKRFI